MEWLDTLSLLSSLISILTFSSTILLAVAGFYLLTSNALREIETLQDEWDCAGKEIYLLLKYWETEKQRGNDQLEHYLKSLQSSLDALAETALYILRESIELKSGGGREGGWIPGIFDVLDLRRRVLWLCKRRDILEKMAEFSRRRQGLIHMQLSLLLTKSIWQEIGSKSQMDLLKSNTFVARSIPDSSVKTPVAEQSR